MYRDAAMPTARALRAARTWTLSLVMIAAVALVGCGDDDDQPPATTRTPTAVPTVTPTADDNQPPELHPVTDQTIVLGSERFVLVTASDPDGDAVAIDVTGLPDNSYFIDDTGVFCFIADDATQVGEPIDITFSATDGELTDSQTITVTVVEPTAADLVKLGAASSLVLDQVGDHQARVGEPLTIQLMARGVSPLEYRAHPASAIANAVTFNEQTGLFRFVPTAAHAGGSFQVTFQACVPTAGVCDTIVQQHETITITVSGEPADCSATYVPEGCVNVVPGSTLPQPIESCFVVRTAGTYSYEYINILKNGALYFADDPAGEIDFRVKSMLVEQGGVLQAGSPSCRFGSHGGKLSIGLYGDDPSHEGSVDPAPVGIRCMTDPNGHSGCFPPGRDPGNNGPFYCTVSDSDDPCSDTVGPATDALNARLDHYGDLNFDSTPWGYKTLGVSYGGTLRLFGNKAAKTTADPIGHCEVPTAEQSTLDAAEMQAWANLTGTSWARLDATTDNDAGTVLTIDRAVPTWQVGDEIVIGATDWYPGHSEYRVIRAITHPPNPDGFTTITVDTLDYPHETRIFDTDVLADQHGAEYTGPVTRKAADLRATVGLLSRSITIRSLGASADAPFPATADCLYKDGATTNPACYFGGHVIIRQGFREAEIQGVEFRQLGQGGRIGHYPVHFHFAKSTAYTQGKAFVKDSSMWDSMTRFIVLHGTHDVDLQRNVGFLSMGHGYYLEDGSEIDNRLCHNLGVSARVALKEYFVAQAAEAEARIAACGGNQTCLATAAPATARFVPGILDGVGASATYNPGGPSLRFGSDNYMPVMYWIMNAHNEQVGNTAVGVHGFGGCFWLLGSGVSGHSYVPPPDPPLFSGLANYNVPGGSQAPLTRFRGNSCTTATYALGASAELSPAAIGEALNTGFTPINNPYVYNPGGGIKSEDFLKGKYSRPAVVGNFLPINPNDNNDRNCASVGTADEGLEPNTRTCVTTVIDRFTTSFNWAQVNYGSIWLRPWFYLLLNPAVTDQLFGGVTFVTSGSWLQVPPAYFSLAKNGLFVGTTQHGGSPYAARSGPIFNVAATDNLTDYKPCSYPGFTTCNLPDQGTGYWTGGYQPKRLINIYDGPHFTDGNLFLNVGTWECNPQPCQGKTPAECAGALECGIYASTFQPLPTRPAGGPPDLKRMLVMDAAIGWKQPNSFYYPPAFTYRAAHFFKTLPTGQPEPPGLKTPLNRCYSADASGAFAFRDGDCRHNVIDRTLDYVIGNLRNLSVGPGYYPGNSNLIPSTPVDFSTILIDLDASLTGASGTISGVSNPVPTTSVSRNAFFDAPAQGDECLSFGVQTSPYEFVTTMVAPLHASPGNAGTYVEPWTYERPNTDPPPATVTAATTPVIGIYRQWKTAKDAASCEQVCSTTNPAQYGCARGTFMIGPDVGHATYLTMAQPPGLTGQPGSLYYIDTSTHAKQALGCIQSRTNAMQTAEFKANDSYVVYNLFARNDSVIGYQFYVGEGASSVAGVQGGYVRVTPHLHSTDNANALGSFRSKVSALCDPTVEGAWCHGMPTPTVANGILTVTLDQRPIKDDFRVAARADYDRCMPRDLCYFDEAMDRCEPCANDPSKCIRQADFLRVDVESMNHVDATGKKPLDVVCQDWGTYASGTTSGELGELSLVDCPAEGCLGYAFTLPSNFVGDKTYAQVGAPLARCFEECAWRDDALVAKTETVGGMSTLADPLCGEPRMQTPTDYCSARCAL